MEQTALILIFISLVLLVIITTLLSLLIYRLLKNQNPPGLQPTTTVQATEGELNKTFHPGILERIKTLEGIRPKRTELFCPNHSEEPGEVSCAICDHLFCRSCIKPFKTMHFCKEHLPLLMRNNWNEVLTIKTSTTDPEQGVRLYEVKKKIFEEDEIPTYIETHYKINIDQDYIETYLVLFAIDDKVNELKERLKNL
jgi:hypothetical protein